MREENRTMQKKVLKWLSLITTNRIKSKQSDRKSQPERSTRNDGEAEYPQQDADKLFFCFMFHNILHSFVKRLI